MKRSLVLIMCLGLIAGSVVSAQAGAKKPQKVEFFLHGTEAVGEVDLANNFGVGYNKMDGTAPTDPTPKSITGLTWVGDPQMWNDCAGMYTLPNWTGLVSGQIKGDMTLTLHTIAGPRQLEVEIWPDIGTQTCASNDLAEGTYPEPAAMAVVDVPPGQGVLEVVFEDVNFKAFGSLLVQVTPVGPAAARILYDSADYPSSLQFSCIPAKGAKSCV